MMFCFIRVVTSLTKLDLLHDLICAYIFSDDSCEINKIVIKTKIVNNQLLIHSSLSADTSLLYSNIYGCN